MLSLYSIVIIILYHIDCQFSNNRLKNILICVLFFHLLQWFRWHICVECIETKKKVSETKIYFFFATASTIATRYILYFDEFLPLSVWCEHEVCKVICIIINLECIYYIHIAYIYVCIYLFCYHAYVSSQSVNRWPVIGHSDSGRRPN